MANICTNALIVTGATKHVTAFIKANTDENFHDYTDLSLDKAVPETTDNISVDDIFLWRQENWGVCYDLDPDDVTIDIVSKNHNESIVTYTFLTSWKAPDAWVKTVGRQHPECNIVLHYDEPSSGLAGSIKVQGNKWSAQDEEPSWQPCIDETCEESADHGLHWLNYDEEPFIGLCAGHATFHNDMSQSAWLNSTLSQVFASCEYNPSRFLTALLADNFNVLDTALKEHPQTVVMKKYLWQAASWIEKKKLVNMWPIDELGQINPTQTAQILQQENKWTDAQTRIAVLTLPSFTGTKSDLLTVIPQLAARTPSTSNSVSLNI